MLQDRIRQAITSSGLTVRGAADATGINKRTLDKWMEKNPPSPSAESLYAFARFADMPMEHFIDGAEGVRYVLDWAGRNGARWKPPPRLEAIVAELEAMDDRCLAVASAMMRAAVAEIVRDAEPQPRAENQ